MANHPRRRRPLRTVLVLLILVLAALFCIRRGNTALQVTRTDLTFTDLPAGFDGCRIAVLSDLHGAEFGENNRDLFSTLVEESPDYIVYLGDLEDHYRGPAAGYAETVAAGLTAIAPTYYVTGNHEWAMGTAVAESVKQAVVEEAKRQAEQIVQQARRTAENEGRAMLAEVRAAIADEIVDAAEKVLAEKLTAAEHEKLITNSLNKVVLH